MAIGSIISTGATIVGAILAKDQGDKGKRIAKAEAKLSEQETEEILRRTEREFERVSSLARARASASGASGASVSAYLEELGAIQQEELDWIEQTGKSRAKIIRKGGQLASTAGNIAALQSLSQAFGYVPQIVDNVRRGRWWA